MVQQQNLERRYSELTPCREEKYIVPQNLWRNISFSDVNTVRAYGGKNVFFGCKWIIKWMIINLFFRVMLVYFELPTIFLGELFWIRPFYFVSLCEINTGETSKIIYKVLENPAWQLWVLIGSGQRVSCCNTFLVTLLWLNITSSFKCGTQNIHCGVFKKVFFIDFYCVYSSVYEKMAKNIKFCEQTSSTNGNKTKNSAFVYGLT